MTSPDYSKLMPVGFDSIKSMQDALSAASDSLAVIFNDPVIGISKNDDPEVESEGGVNYGKSIYNQLEDVRSSVYDCASFPIASLMNTISYSQTLVTAAGKASNVTDATLIETLTTVAQTWMSIDTVSACERAEGARSTIQKVANSLDDHQADIEGIIIAMQNIIQPGSQDERDQDLDSDIFKPIYQLFADAFVPLTTLKDSANDRVRLANVLDLPLIDGSTDYLGITFPDLFKASEPQAAELVETMKSYATHVFVLNNHVASLLQYHLANLVTSTANLSSAVTRVPAGIQAFSQSTSTLTVRNASKEIVVLSWTAILNLASAYQRDLGAKASSTVKVAPQNAFNSLDRKPQSNPAIKSKYTLETTRSVTGKTVTPKTVEAAFGVPAGSDATMPELSQVTSSIIKKFDEVLTLPYTDAIKVSNDQGANISIFQLVTELQRSFHLLQNKSVVFTKDLSSYAEIQTIMLPSVEQPGPDGISIDELLMINTQMYLEFSSVAEETVKAMTKLWGSYSDSVALLRMGIKSVDKQINDLKRQIQTTSEDRKAALIQGVIEGIFTVLFVIGAGVSFGTGAGAAIGVTLGIKAGESLQATVEKFVKAGDINKLLKNLEQLLANCQTTYNGLADLLPLLTLFASSSLEVATIWFSIEKSLEMVDNDKAQWVGHPEYFTDAMVQLAVQDWEDMVSSCDAFAKLIGGVVLSNNVSEALRVIEEKYGFKSVNKLKTKARTFAINAKYPLSLQTIMDERAQMEVVNFLSAPDLSLNSLRPDDIQVLMSNYFLLAQNLQNIGLNDLSKRCSDLSVTLMNEILPAIKAAVTPLFEFAVNQPELPTIPATADAWNMFCTQKNQKLQLGNQQALVCDALLRNMQQTLELVNNDVIRSLSEAQSNLAGAQNELNQKRSEYASYSWMKIVPVLNIIELIVEAIKKDEQTIDELNIRIRQLNAVAQILAQSTAISQQLFSTTSSLSAAWAKMTTDTYVAANLWEKFETYPTAEVALAQKTWKIIIDNLQGWVM